MMASDGDEITWPTRGFERGGKVEDSLRVFVCTSGAAVALFFVEDGLLPFKAMCPLWFTLTRGERHLVTDSARGIFTLFRGSLGSGLSNW